MSHRRYEIKRSGVGLSALKLPRELKDRLSEMGYESAEALYAAIVGSPATFGLLLADYGVDVDGLLEDLRKLLSKSTVEAIDATPRPRMRMGARKPPAFSGGEIIRRKS